MPSTPDGSRYAFDLTAGVGTQDLLTRSGNQFDYTQDSITDNVFGNPSSMASSVGGVTKPTVNYLWYILGIFIILMALKFASEHEKSGVDPKIVGVGVYNFITVGLLAMLFLIVARTLANKYYIKGITEIVNAA